MKKENLILVVIALIVGMLGGYLIFSISGRKEPPPMGGGVPVGSGTPADYQQRIATAERIVAADPRNRQAWVQLGNDCFDTGQFQKAVDAYGKALELKPDDPNVLTDQGVMYRQLKQYDRAIANFEKAQQLDPKHLQSLFNLGLLYAQDLKQNEKAIKALNRFLEIDSTSPTAQQIKGMVEQLKNGPKGFK